MADNSPKLAASSSGLGLGDAGPRQCDEVDCRASELQGPLCFEASGVAELTDQASGPVRSGLDGGKTPLQSRQIGPTL